MLNIQPAIMNAACSVAKTIDDVRALANTPIGAITVGSITVAPRDGNPEPRWHTGEGYAINSFGMPNSGADFYRDNLPEMIKIAHDANKKFNLSVAGFNTAEYVELAQLAQDAGVDYLELNLGCPNISIDGQQKPIASFDREYISEIITSVQKVTDLPLLIKLSPYSNPGELKQVAELLSTMSIAAVVTSNTFPNSYETDSDGKPVIASTFGGLSGAALRAIAVGQVKQFRDALPPEIAVIGVGGVESSDDVEQYIHAGATAVQAGTLIVRDGHTAIKGIVA
jgi:dihydroorotate dehydrogenase (fumarate)